MIRSEREQIIQRYLSGEMSSAEEGDFFIQVALDRELRHDLQAQQTIESAFRKDREAERVGHTGLRTRVASMLAAGPPAARPSVSGEAPLPGAGETAPTGTVPPSPALPDALPSRGGSIVGWSALVLGAITAVIIFLLADPFGATQAPPPHSSPAESGGNLPTPTQRKDAPAGVITPGASSSSEERPSSPAITIPTRPHRSALQDRTSTAPSRSDGGVRERSARTRPATSSTHEATEEEGTRQDPAPDKMKVGVRVKIKPQQ
jgi:hypothetical protein